MSYTTEKREELLNGMPKKSCCRRAVLFSALAMRGECRGELVFLPVSWKGFLPFLTEEIFSTYGKMPAVASCPGFLAGLSFKGKSALAYLDAISEGDGIFPPPFKVCPECRSAFFRGIFLTVGSMQAPEKGYRLDFSAGERRPQLEAFLTALGYPPKQLDRRKEKILYYKDNSSVSDLMTYMGLSQVSFDVINTVIEKELKRDAVRRANCETGNITKAVNASHKQIELISRLFARGKGGMLPPDLEETARLRLEHRDLSLSQLSQMMSPPITKSGLNHRLQKIMALAEELLSAGKERE